MEEYKKEKIGKYEVTVYVTKTKKGWIASVNITEHMINEVKDTVYDCPEGKYYESKDEAGKAALSWAKKNI